MDIVGRSFDLFKLCFQGIVVDCKCLRVATVRILILLGSRYFVIHLSQGLRRLVIWHSTEACLRETGGGHPGPHPCGSQSCALLFICFIIYLGFCIRFHLQYNFKSVRKLFFKSIKAFTLVNPIFKLCYESFLMFPKTSIKDLFKYV